jgi:HEAT repeat protein
LLETANDDKESLSLRRAAVEALGYSSRPEAETLIRSAFKREDPEWQASALIAMGRSNDEGWKDETIGALYHEDARVRLAAVRAAGELSLPEARLILLKFLEEGDEEEIARAAVWSLSEIGGEDVRVYLLNLQDQTEDEDLSNFIEDALENLDFTEELASFDLMTLDDEDDIVTP